MDSIIYNYEILNITKQTYNGLDDVITNVLWKKVGINTSGACGEFCVETPLDIPKNFDENFVNYQNLSKENIINWIESIENQTEIEKSIREQIEQLESNKVKIVNGNFPWQTN